MASGLFIGLTECELLDIKAKAVAMITESQYNKRSEEIKTTSEYTKFYKSIINTISAAKTNPLICSLFSFVHDP